jgi:hypothetical protein
VTSSDALVVYKNGNVTITGSDNELPYQQLVGNNSILTRGLADERYVPHSPGTGVHSLALGYETTASGYGSTAFGVQTTGTGAYSTALGHATTASGYGSTAFGGWTSASGYGSTAFGIDTSGTGMYSTAFGVDTHAYGYGSTAFGAGSKALNYFTTAFGSGSTASGQYSTAMGYNTTASADYSTAMGRYNLGGGSPTELSGTNPLFEVGNGSSNTSRSDALEVCQNGDTIVTGTLCVSGTTDCILVNRAGDISMGAFTNGPKPQ